MRASNAIICSCSSVGAFHVLLRQDTAFVLVLSQLH
jgi:hypothetical protein